MFGVLISQAICKNLRSHGP